MAGGIHSETDDHVIVPRRVERIGEVPGGVIARQNDATAPAEPRQRRIEAGRGFEPGEPTWPACG